MPSRLAAPVLHVDAETLNNVDIRNAENLFGMWTVFSKCAGFSEEGKRLENLSWRLWNQEVFCCARRPATAPSADVSLIRPSSKTEVPDLSASVDSCSTACGTAETRGGLSSHLHTSQRKNPALAQNRRIEKHLTPETFSKIVATIQSKKELEPLSLRPRQSQPATTDVTPRPASPPSKVENTDQEEVERHSQRSSDSCYSNGTIESNDGKQSIASDTSVSSAGMTKSSSIVRGFSPSHISSSYRSKTNLTQTRPLPTQSKIPARSEVCKKKPAVFTLGASSGEDDESSFEERLASLRPQRSSLSEGLSKPLQGKKQTSFRDIVESRTIQESGEDNEDAIASDDDISDSAIDDEDEDEEDWEDSDTESGRSSVEEKPLFQRVDSRPNLVSRRSMLTTLMHEPQRAAALANAASQSQPVLRRSRNSSANGPSVPGTPQDSGKLLEIKGSDVPRSKPIIVTTSNTHPPLLSPRTTRRNMLNAELTESLRRHLLWERQQKSTTANAVYKRRHTAHDMANLKDYPAGQGPKDASKNNSWNNGYDHGPWEYHTKGW